MSLFLRDQRRLLQDQFKCLLTPFIVDLGGYMAQSVPAPEYGAYTCSGLITEPDPAKGIDDTRVPNVLGAGVKQLAFSVECVARIPEGGSVANN